MWIEGRPIGSKALTIPDAYATSIKKNDEESSKEEKYKAKISKGPKSFFNSILSFFEVL